MAEFRWTVLVIDDDPDILRVVGRTLEPEGFRVLTAVDPEMGFEIAQTEPVHLILLDVNMPGMDGFELLKKLREDDWTEDIPVMMLTGRDRVKDFDQARRTGAFDYLTKPFSAEVLSRRIRRAFAYAYFGRDKISEAKEGEGDLAGDDDDDESDDNLEEVHDPEAEGSPEAEKS